MASTEEVLVARAARTAAARVDVGQGFARTAWAPATSARVRIGGERSQVSTG
jgi:hypothetical protein